MSAIPQQKVVRVTYTIDDVFRIPSWIDLENKEQVENWGVKYNTLHIYLTNGKILDINSEDWISGQDYKYPSDNAEIEDIDTYGFDNLCDRCKEFSEELQFIHNRTLCGECVERYYCCMCDYDTADNEQISFQDDKMYCFECVPKEEEETKETKEQEKPIVIKPSDEELDKIISLYITDETHNEKVSVQRVTIDGKNYLREKITGAVFDQDTKECIGLYKNANEFRLDLQEYYDKNYCELEL